MFPDAEKLVLLEEDLEVSPDFLRYALAFLVPSGRIIQPLRESTHAPEHESVRGHSHTR